MSIPCAEPPGYLEAGTKGHFPAFCARHCPSAARCRLLRAQLTGTGPVPLLMPWLELPRLPRLLCDHEPPEGLRKPHARELGTIRQRAGPLYVHCNRGAHLEQLRVKMVMEGGGER